MTDRQYEIKKNLLGQYAVHYGCPRCGERLKSALSHAGNTDSCPNCHTPFVIPGMDDRTLIEETQQIDKEQKQLAAEERKQERLDRKMQRQLEKAALEEQRQQQVAQRLRASHLQIELDQSATRSCPYCAEQILAAAVKCKHCGEFLDGRKKASAAKSRQPQNASTLTGVLTVILLGLVGFCCMGVINDIGSTGGRGGVPSPSETGLSSPSQTSVSTEPAKLDAWVMAQQFVEEQLKAPSSASFGSSFSDYPDPDKVVKALPGGKFRVNAWVDSQNSFGAQIRTRFSCELEYLGNDRWRRISLKLLE